MAKESEFGPLDPPDSKPYFHLWASKAPRDIQRNLLLNFIHDRGLDDEVMAYLERHLPLEED